MGITGIRPRMGPTPGGMLAVLVLLAGGLAVYASAPTAPLPAPLYSFDAESPKVTAEVVGAADVLEFADPDLLTLLTGSDLGTGAASDELDALSAANNGVSGTDLLSLLFSVDRQSRGLALPDPDLVAAGTPFNTRDQADRGHAAGDQFMSTAVFSLDSGVSQATLIDDNNTLVRNNFDEGGHDFVADPPTSADDPAPPDRSTEDNVDATAFFDNRVAGEPPIDVYFSLSAASPSLATLSGAAVPSGANVFYNADPSGSAGTTLFAAYDSLGLAQDDDIDAMVVMDTNLDGIFNGSDVVLFSLAPGSPSLATIAAASPSGAAADVFRADPGLEAAVFVSAAQLGLGDPLDNIDALDITSSSGARAASPGIRRVCGDYNNDGYTDLDDFSLFEACFTGPDGAIADGCERGDCAATDGAIDCNDWLLFLESWSDVADPPTLAQCIGVEEGAIPTMDQWGLLVLALLVLVAGTLLLRSRPVPAA